MKRIEKGWCKGIKLRDPHIKLLSSRHATKFCALGAISDKDQDFRINDNIATAARRLLSYNLPGPFNTVASFNDNSYTTKEDVINLFKRTIERLKNDQPEAT